MVSKEMENNTFYKYNLFYTLDFLLKIHASKMILSNHQYSFYMF